MEQKIMQRDIQTNYSVQASDGLTRFKKKKRVLLWVMIGIGLYTIITVYLISGFRILFPGQETQVIVSTPDQEGASSQFYLIKFDKTKIKLSGQEVWGNPYDDYMDYFNSDSEEAVIYDIKRKNKYLVSYGDEMTEKIIPNDKRNEVYLADDGIIVQYQGKRMFDVSARGETYKIKIKNVSKGITVIQSHVDNREGAVLQKNETE